MKTKYIKVSVKDKLPKYGWAVANYKLFLEEVPDYEEEMKEMLEFIYGYGEKVDWSKFRPQLEELLTKLNQQS